MTQMYGGVETTLRQAGPGTDREVRVSPTGEQVVRDFWADMAIQGKCYQVRLGTVVTAITGDVPVADASAEAAVNAADGTTVIPAQLAVSFTANLGAPNHIFLKSAPTAATAGTAFVPLPLMTTGQSAAVSTALTGTAGSVTVPAELATTTRRIWGFTSPGVVAAATNPSTEATVSVLWNAKVPHLVRGTSAASSCFYLQVGATGTAPTYFAHFDYVELSTSLLTGN